MVKKINIVTKRLVGNNEQIRKQNNRISDQERIYVDIKGVVKHLPGLETPEEKQYYEVLFEAKKEQLTTLQHEIYANEAQTAFFRTQVAQLSKRMEELKSQYFKKKQVELCQQTGNRDKSCWKKRKSIEQCSSSRISNMPSIRVDEWDGEDAGYLPLQLEYPGEEPGEFLYEVDYEQEDEVTEETENVEEEQSQIMDEESEMIEEEEQEIEELEEDSKATLNE